MIFFSQFFTFFRYDVFVGIDVFGRGCPGGGGWNSSEAAKIIQKFDMSVAIFAPGWVLECNEPKCFRSNQDKFWSLIAPFLPTHPLYSLPNTNFCLGYGRKTFIEGIEDRQIAATDCHEKFWYNLSSQSLQPCRAALSRKCGESQDVPKMGFCHDDSWMGGGEFLKVK